MEALFDEVVSNDEWGGRRRGRKNYRRLSSNSAKDYVGNTVEEPIYPTENFPMLFEIPRTLYKKVKEDVLEYKPTYWCTLMVG